MANLAKVGLNPVITVTEACADASTDSRWMRFLEFLHRAGLSRPRLKVLPLIRLGAETSRARGYQEWQTLAGVSLTPEEADALQCARGRMVCERGVYVCPILIDSPDAMMGATLTETLRPFTLRYQPCWSCHFAGRSHRPSS